MRTPTQVPQPLDVLVAEPASLFDSRLFHLALVTVASMLLSPVVAGVARRLSAMW